MSKFVNEILKEKIANLDEATFNEYKASLESTKKQKDKNLAAEATRFWGEIVKHSYEFQRKEKEIDFIPTISLQEFKLYPFCHLDSSTPSSTTTPASSKSIKSRGPLSRPQGR